MSAFNIIQWIMTLFLLFLEPSYEDIPEIVRIPL